MEKCFYTSCPLNNKKSFKEYKKNSPNMNYFINVPVNSPLIKAINIISSTKGNYCFCTEHYNFLIKFKTLKDSFDKQGNSKTKLKDIEILATMNELSRYDINMKRLFAKTEIEGNKTFISYLFNFLSNPPKDKLIELYSQINISNLFKEFEIVKPYSNIETIEIFINYFLKMNFSANYSNNNKLSMEQSEIEKILNSFLIYELTLNNIGYIILNTKEKSIMNDCMIQLFENVTKTLGELISFYNTIPKNIKNDEEKNKKFTLLMYKCYNEVFYSITGFIHIYLISKIKQIDTSVFLVNFIVKMDKNIFEFMEYSKEDFSHKGFIIMLYDLLNLILSVKISEFTIEKLSAFADNCVEYLEKKTFPLCVENIKNISIIKERIEIYQGENNFD